MLKVPEGCSWFNTYSQKTNILNSTIRIAKYSQKWNESDFIEIRAIWDTGASSSAISENIVSKLNLHPINLIKVDTANGLHETTTHSITAALPNNMIIPGMTVTKARLGDDLDMLIGMDIIGCGDFIVSTNQEMLSFGFKVPSHELLYFYQGNKPIFTKANNGSIKVDLNQNILGRNDECRCGSGKKYKKCCGK